MATLCCEDGGTLPGDGANGEELINCRHGGGREGKNPWRAGLGDLGADNDFTLFGVVIVGHQLERFTRTDACIYLETDEGKITQAGVSCLVWASASSASRK